MIKSDIALKGGTGVEVGSKAACKRDKESRVSELSVV